MNVTNKFNNCLESLLVILLSLLICSTGIYFLWVIKKEPIRIGFVAELTGKHAELGVQERNGAQLAIEKINAQGGIAGRQVMLIVRDDLGTLDGAKTADRELIDEGVAAIIGHATSVQTIGGLQVTNPARVVMVGPTISSPIITGKYDYFFRVHPTFSTTVKGFANHIYSDRRVKKMAIIYDIENSAYSETYRRIFSDDYRAMGGVVNDQIGFSSKNRNDFSKLLSQLCNSDSEGLLIIAADIDTAMIAQRARLLDWQVPLFAASWAQTPTLIYNGGNAVEGLEIEQAYAANSQTLEFIDFQNRYQERYGRVPTFGAAYGYEAAMVLASGLQKTNGNREGMRQALLELQDFKGLSDHFSFDQNGDVVRASYLNVIRNGSFEISKSLD